MKTVFISKDAAELDGLVSFLNLRAKIHCQSLIEFQAVPFDCPKDFDVIFFSSIRCAQFLEASKHIDFNAYSLGCGGSQTALRLAEKGYELSFYGENGSMPDVVSKEFSHWLGDRKVFIPRSNRSLRSIEAHIPEDQVQSVVVYQTLLAPSKIKTADIMVFSSPSNVHAYFSENTLLDSALLISWGSSTSAVLKDYGFVPDCVLKEGSISELQELLDGRLLI